mgnify:CR=1 FL=1
MKKTDAEAKNGAQNAMSGARRAKDGGLEMEVCGVCRAMLIESGVEVRPLETAARKITCQVCCKRRYGGVCNVKTNHRAEAANGLADYMEAQHEHFYSGGTGGA